MSYIFWTIVFIIVLVIAGKSIVVVRQATRVVVERLGQYSRTLEPGLRMMVPFIESVRRVVDMREQVWDYPSQEIITKDNVVVKIDNVMYYMVTDPVKATYEVQNVDQAILKLTQTSIRNVCGNLTLDELLTSREKINEVLRQDLDKATDPWGIKVTRVELKAINPPPEIQEAMTKQMKAERDKRAMVLEAEGVKQSAILKAEGEKQSAILKAEGEKQSHILKAEGEAQAIMTVAKAKASAVEVYFEGIHKGNPTKDVIAIQYMDTLNKIADGKATKVFLPYESSALLGSLGTIKEIFNGKDNKEIT
jgi:regulator of protease activity HflC (stomatin/prohibitin superfamily)